MVSLIKALAVLFLLQKEPSHVSVQNVQIFQPQALHEKRCPSSQKKLPERQPDARWDPAVGGALLFPVAGVYQPYPECEREAAVEVLSE